MRWMTFAITFLLTAVALSGQSQRPAIIDLWMSGKPAFGIYAPNENAGPRGQGPRPAVYTREGGEKLAMNPLYDFVFLNLEGSYDGAAIRRSRTDCGAAPPRAARRSSSASRRSRRMVPTRHVCA